ncbi:hypothetical protein EMB92_03475 [Bifidobacterium callitrichos]|uniref:Uncharacterized protein n=1 Tax=Bifidobacterium callitrichos TaxID=762209 RepID=A0A5M9ZEQ2_9BIFI|nr:hypothetical protein [Bifidobacterium callitrichos]KAA8817617.1 hypothetical protein EMB92_03475 [Bifidobacterium callitrichos]
MSDNGVIRSSARVRLSESWFPGEWLEPVHPDIVRSFLQDYGIAMGKLMTRYLRDQGVDDGIGEDPSGRSAGDVCDTPDCESDNGHDHLALGVDFMNICLIIDQKHTFPIQTRNLARIGYEPDEESVMEATLAIQSEFDGFVDFIAGLPADIDRREFVVAVEREYGFDGDIESMTMLRTLAKRAAEELAKKTVRGWFAASAEPSNATSELIARWRLDSPSEPSMMLAMAGTPSSDGYASKNPTVPERLRDAMSSWARCVAGNRRNTPRRREQVLSWCVWHAVLSAVWKRERMAYDEHWRGVDQSSRDPRCYCALADAIHEDADRVGVAVGRGTDEETDDGVLDGGLWNQLMARMFFVHRAVSRGYSRWCDLMPPEGDVAQLRLACRMIADDPSFIDVTLFALCNALIYDRIDPPSTARKAMRNLFDYACVSRMVASPGGGSGVREYAYVGLRKAICGYAGYRGERRELSGASYERYLAMIGKKSDGGSRGRTSKSVWVYPGMADWYATSDARDTIVSGVSEVLAGNDAYEDDAMSDAVWRFHQASDRAVSEWLASETVHATGLDGHGHFLSYRAADPVSPYQDVNAWRLGTALERYEGTVMWGSGSRLARLYRERGHLSKQGGQVTDRGVRDYAISARGTGDAIQYIASVAGFGGLLASERGVELLARLVDACDANGGDRFHKACWTLIRLARYKRHRLTVPCGTGRRAGMRLLDAAMGAKGRSDGAKDALVSELKLVNLLRTFHRMEVSTAKTMISNMESRDVADMIDLAEHIVHDTAQAVCIRLRSAGRIPASVRPTPLDCIGMHTGAFVEVECVFGRGLHATDEHGASRRTRRGSSNREVC